MTFWDQFCWLTFLSNSYTERILDHEQQRNILIPNLCIQHLKRLKTEGKGTGTRLLPIQISLDYTYITAENDSKNVPRSSIFHLAF